MLTLSAPPDFKKGIGSRVEVGGDLIVSSVASGSGSAPEGEPMARRECEPFLTFTPANSIFESTFRAYFGPLNPYGMEGNNLGTCLSYLRNFRED